MKKLGNENIETQQLSPLSIDNQSCSIGMTEKVMENLVMREKTQNMLPLDLTRSCNINMTETNLPGSMENLYTKYTSI